MGCSLGSLLPALLKKSPGRRTTSSSSSRYVSIPASSPVERFRRACSLCPSGALRGCRQAGFRDLIVAASRDCSRRQRVMRKGHFAEIDGRQVSISSDQTGRPLESPPNGKFEKEVMKQHIHSRQRRWLWWYIRYQYDRRVSMRRVDFSARVLNRAEKGFDWFD